MSEVADRVVVMYGGQVAETGATSRRSSARRATTTRAACCRAVLSLEENRAALTQIAGVVPSPADFGPGCRFADRCPAARAICRVERPTDDGAHPDHLVACHAPAGRIPVGRGVLVRGGES